jgi:hypothetical protein
VVRVTGELKPRGRANWTSDSEAICCPWLPIYFSPVSNTNHWPVASPEDTRWWGYPLALVSEETVLKGAAYQTLCWQPEVVEARWKNGMGSADILMTLADCFSIKSDQMSQVCWRSSIPLRLGVPQGFHEFWPRPSFDVMTCRRSSSRFLQGLPQWLLWWAWKTADTWIVIPRKHHVSGRTNMEALRKGVGTWSF